jgi:hypothetical protein
MSPKPIKIAILAMGGEGGGVRDKPSLKDFADRADEPRGGKESY